MADYSIPNSDILSRFNSGMLINLRLNNLWILTHTYARKGKYSDWSGVLDRIWCELAGDIGKDENGKTINKEFNLIEEELSKVGVTNWGKPEGFEKQDDKIKLVMTKQYRLIMKKEIFLRQLQNKQGKGTAYYDETENDWE